MKDINYIFTKHSLFYFAVLVSIALIYGLLNLFDSLFLQWLSISVLFISVTSGVLFILKKHNEKIVYDVLQIRDYLEDISNKEYTSALHIKHFKEYLEISVLLKNIVKRLNAKDKKKK